tara:strand:- start:117 stop:281 length:165 start_codon:yes stop_codon:yes gene_type:complete
MSNTLTAKDFLEVCEYVSQDDDTVYIDEDELVKCMEQYAAYLNKKTEPSRFKRT